MDTAQSERVMTSRPVPDSARNLAAQLNALFAQDAALVRRLNAAQRRLQSANDRLWWGLHPDGLAAVYAEDPAAVEVAFAEHRSEVARRPRPARRGPTSPLDRARRIPQLPSGRRATPPARRRNRRGHPPIRGHARGRRLVRAARAQRQRPRDRNQQTSKHEELRDGNDTDPAVRDHRQGPRPGARRARRGQPGAPAPGVPDAPDIREVENAVARAGRRS